MFSTIKSALADLDLAVFDSDATDTTTDHYVLLLAPGVSRSGEDSIGCGGAVDLIVRAVGVTPEHARLILSETRSRLRNLHAGGWSFYWDGSPRQVQVERNVRIAGTNTSIAFVDDEYTVYRSE